MKSRLTVKIFLITTALYLFVAFVTYGFIVLYAPRHLLVEKKQDVTKEAKVLLSKMKEVSVEEGRKILESYISGNVITIQPKDGEGAKFSSTPSADLEILTGEGQVLKTMMSQSVDGEMKVEKKQVIPFYKEIHEFQFADSTNFYTMTMVVSQQSAQLIALTLHKVLPPLLIVVFFTALIVSLFYSQYITRPIIRMSAVSRKLASLNFDITCEENRKDEVGILAGNLNELSQKLKVALDELRGANDLLREDVEREKELEGQQLAFFSAVSHELKTPITILMGQLQGMLYLVGGYKDRDKYLKRAYEIACSMDSLVKEILTVTRIKSSKFSLQREEVNLSAFITEILESYEELLYNKDITVITDVETDRFISVDKSLFAKVISNLISNAYHYSPEGEQIRIQVGSADSNILCSIENTGVHIPDQEIQGLFEAFARREPSRNRETGGSGLGLYIVQMALDLHNFKYCMENTIDGVLFRITC